MHVWTAPPGTPPPVEQPWIELEAAPPLPSALDAVTPDDEATLPEDGSHASVRTRWYLRPRAAVTVLPDRWHPDLGIVVGHQWWKFTDVAVAPAGETRLAATLPLGEPGYDLSLASVGGAWFARRVAVFVGPDLQADRIRWNDAYTDHAVDLGPTARVAFALGPVTPWVDATPLWILDGTRPPLAGEPWDAFRMRAGVLVGRRLQLKLDAAHESTGAGTIDEVSAGVHFHLG